MKLSITGYHLDKANDWVAELSCRHFQHARHNPSWNNREWVVIEAGRSSQLGASLNYVKCDRSKPRDA